MFSVPDRRRGHRDPPDPDDGRPARSTTSTSPTATSPTSGVIGERRQRLDAADGRAQRRAADPRRDSRSGIGASGRSTTLLDYVKERKQFGRPIGSLPDAPAPHRRPRHRDRVHPPAGLRRRPQGRRRPRRRCCPARPRWPSSRPPRSPSGSSLEGDADDGRLRLRLRVRHGAPRPRDAGDPRSTAAPTRSSARSSSKTYGL